MTIYFLPLQEYTISNALLWGNCQSHWHVFKAESNWSGKTVVHVTLASIEALPVIGQFVSLIEMVAAWIFALVPVRPQGVIKTGDFFVCTESAPPEFVKGALEPESELGANDDSLLQRLRGTVRCPLRLSWASATVREWLGSSKKKRPPIPGEFCA